MHDDELHYETHMAIEILSKYVPKSDRDVAIAELKRHIAEWRTQRDETLRRLSSSN